MMRYFTFEQYSSQSFPYFSLQACPSRRSLCTADTEQNSVHKKAVQAVASLHFLSDNGTSCPSESSVLGSCHTGSKLIIGFWDPRVYLAECQSR